MVEGLSSSLNSSDWFPPAFKTYQEWMLAQLANLEAALAK